MYEDAAAHGSYVGGYWTGQAVDHHDLVGFDPAQFRKEGLGLYNGDQIAVLFYGRWVAAFVGIIGDPHHAWARMLMSPDVDFEMDGKLTDLPRTPEIRRHIPSSVKSIQVVDRRDWKFTCYPPPNEPFIDVTVIVREGRGITGTLIDERELLNDPRNWRENFCCSYEVVRVYQSQWSTHLREIDGATIVINRESKGVLRRLSTSPSQQDAFLRRMPQQRQCLEGSFDREFGRRGPRRAWSRDSRGASLRRGSSNRGRYGFDDQSDWPRPEQAQREPGRDRRDFSQDHSHYSRHQQTSGTPSMIHGTFRGHPVTLPGPSSKTPLMSSLECKSYLDVEPAAPAKPEITRADTLKPSVEPAPGSTKKHTLTLTDKFGVEIIIGGPKSSLKYKPGVGYVVKLEITRADTLKSAAEPKALFKLEPAVEPVSRRAPEPTVTPTSDFDFTSAVEPKPAAALKPADKLRSRVATAPAHHDATGFAEGWTRRKSCIQTSTGSEPTVVLPPRHESPPTSEDSHRLAVAECVAKYVKVPVKSRRKRSRRLRRPAHASSKDGEKFNDARQTSLQAGTAARRQYDGRSLNRRDNRCRGKSGRPPDPRLPSDTSAASTDELFYNGIDRWGTLSTDPVVPAPATVDDIGDIDKVQIDDVQPPPSELGDSSPEGVGELVFPEGVGELTFPEGARKQAPVKDAGNPDDTIRHLFRGSRRYPPWRLQ